ncbi:MAG TPA: GTP 3',8-cyclase MoaA [Candidatus Omnitrophica bacterium]|nr:MAG: cyclic pyranopterin phosphate synthase [Omnitrophica WOR_2 bacterium GWA2_45_18]HBR15878.1 GTP 3',8-cyclase MoaA [Candidatus Omnitrophota bacterium]
MTLKLQIPPLNLQSNSKKTSVHDTLDRQLHDLRLSVIDRCNFRCNYCMPQGSNPSRYSFLHEKEWLTLKEIVRLSTLFAQLGVSKLRISGGEPLLRPNLAELIHQLSLIDGIEDLALTTNGSLLSQQADSLKKAGLNRITVSLDTLDPQLFKRINGHKGTVEQVLKGIEEAVRVNFDCVKINVVVQKGINDHHILDLVEYFKGKKPILRFIEFMDAGNCNNWKAQDVLPASEIVKIIHAYYPIEPLKPNYWGEVASRYKFMDGSGEVGFISSVTQPFCRSCTRARLSTDGKIYACLFSPHCTDLRKLLREGHSDEALLNLILKVWQSRDDRYSELRPQIRASHVQSAKIEMFQIGG